MTWEIEETAIDGCFLVHYPIFKDERGFFAEIYKASVFKELKLPYLNQDNFLYSIRGAIRAMHWQSEPYTQAKLVHVIKGSIFDVIYDLREDSRTVGKYANFNLNEGSPMLYVPAGCAHGFQTTSDDSIVTYKTDKEYEPKSQNSFLWNDPEVGIEWPIPNAIVSEKDAAAPLLKNVMYSHE